MNDDFDDASTSAGPPSDVVKAPPSRPLVHDPAGVLALEVARELANAFTTQQPALGCKSVQAIIEKFVAINIDKMSAESPSAFPTSSAFNSAFS